MTAETSEELRARDLQGNLLLRPGTVVGDYRVLQMLAAGGLGTVFLTEENWVLKTFRIDPGWSESERAECEAYFARECLLHPSLSHPHIVPARPALVSQGETFLPLKYMAGGSLKQWLRAPSPQSIGDVLRVLIQCAEGLRYLAREGLVHRDVSPSNILLDERGVAYLADFGFARLLPNEHASSPESMSYGIGRWAYGAPELYDGLDQTYDHRVDIYSLGVVGIALLTHRPPRRWRPERYRPEIPQQFADLLWAMVDDGPSSRPSWEDVIATLKQLLVAGGY